MRTIAVVNQKGGCGKTTVAINLASELARAGKKTLLVDMDPQSHCAVGLAVPEEQIEQSIYDVLIGAVRDEPIRMQEILWEIGENFELAPASIDLAAFEQQMVGVAGREDCLSFVLQDVEETYDFVVVDCPPSVGLLTFVALRAASDVIVPVDTGYFSLHGLSRQLDTLSVLCKQCPRPISVYVLASMYDIRTKMGREILGELRTKFGEQMFETVVNFNTKLKEAASLGQPISEYDAASKGHRDFTALAAEVIGQAGAEERRRKPLESLQHQLAAISTSAEELLQTMKPPAETVREKAAEPSAEATDRKIAEFYGVKQVSDAVLFSTLYPRAAAVQVAGDFNNWRPENGLMQKIGQTGLWQIKLPLSPGKYQYRLVVDGKWQQDPYNEHTTLNPFGELNSVIEVQ